MGFAASKYLVWGVSFALIFLSGYWLSRAGRPYGTVLITAHKLIGLAALMYLLASAYRAPQSAALGTA